MGRHLARAAFVAIAVVVVPLAAYWLAVAAANHGLGWQGFAAALLGVPLAATVAAGAVLRVGRGGVAAGAAGAVAATVALVVVLVFIALDVR